MQYTKIGKVQKPLGTRGELRVDVPDEFYEVFLASNHVFLRINGSYVPWFIEEVREANHLIVKLEEVDTPEKAATFTLCDMFLRTASIPSHILDTFHPADEWIGFCIVNGDETVGLIDDVIAYPQQWMASVFVDGKNILIPLAESLIDRVDDEQKILYMQLPDGLLGL